MVTLYTKDQKPEIQCLPQTMADFCLILDGQLCPVVLWDASVHPEGNSVLMLTWGEYQNTLKQRCLMPKSFSPKPDSICSTVHHYEWSKLALFDFLLQVIKRGLYLCNKERFSSSQLKQSDMNETYM